MNDKILYWNKEVADILKVGDSTIRKWCLLLEERGYTFLKDEQNRRGFRDQDVVLLRRLRDLLKQQGMTLENATNAVMSTGQPPVVTEVVRVETQERDSFVENDVKEYMRKQEHFNKALIERLDKQQEHYESLIKQQQSYIENAIKTRDERLTEAVREIQDTRRLIAATAEDEKKKKPWWKFGR